MSMITIKYIYMEDLHDIIKVGVKIYLFKHKTHPDDLSKYGYWAAFIILMIA